MPRTERCDEPSRATNSSEGTDGGLVPVEDVGHSDQFDTVDPDIAGEVTVAVTVEAVGCEAETTAVQERLPVDREPRPLFARSRERTIG